MNSEIFYLALLLLVGTIVLWRVATWLKQLRLLMQTKEQTSHTVADQVVSHEPIQSKMRREKIVEFERRRERGTPELRQMLQEMTVHDVPIAEVGDLMWWPNVDHTTILAAIRLNDGRCLVVGYDDGRFVFPVASEDSHVLDNLTQLPKFTFDDFAGGIEIWFESRLYIIVSHSYDIGTGQHVWKYGKMMEGEISSRSESVDWYADDSCRVLNELHASKSNAEWEEFFHSIPPGETRTIKLK